VNRAENDAQNKILTDQEQIQDFGVEQKQTIIDALNSQLPKQKAAILGAETQQEGQIISALQKQAAVTQQQMDQQYLNVQNEQTRVVLASQIRK